MKVLEKGREQSGPAFKAACTGAGNDGGGCGAKLLVEAGDLFETFSHARDETDTYVTFACPDCGTKTDVPNPGQWQREAARAGTRRRAEEARGPAMSATKETP